MFSPEWGNLYRTNLAFYNKPNADDVYNGALADLSTGAKILTPTEFEL